MNKRLSRFPQTTGPHNRAPSRYAWALSIKWGGRLMAEKRCSAKERRITHAPYLTGNKRRNTPLYEGYFLNESDRKCTRNTGIYFLFIQLFNFSRQWYWLIWVFQNKYRRIRMTEVLIKVKFHRNNISRSHFRHVLRSEIKEGREMDENEDKLSDKG